MSAMKERLLAILGRFSGQTVLVAGDFVGDEYLYCRTSRISREAPAALVLTYERRELRLGGGANAVANLRALGGVVEPVGVVGDDAMGREIGELMRAQKIDTSGLVSDPSALTVVKTRVMTSTYHSVKQQVMRIDREPALAPRGGPDQRCAELLAERVARADALLIADYGYGSAAPALVQAAVAAARARGIPVTLDSRHRLLAFPGVSAATPNEEEAEEALGRTLGDDLERLVAGGRELRARLGSEALLITRGSRGMAVFDGAERPHVLGVYGSDEIADVTGAGDTVIATFTLALASGASYLEAALLASYAGGLVVMKQGTATIAGPELAAALEGDDALRESWAGC